MQNEDENKILAAKLSAMFAIGIISFVCGIMPYYCIQAWRSRFPTSTIHKITGGIVCFSGGTLLGVTFLHLLPEVREKLELIPKDDWSFGRNLPLSDIIAMIGFFGVYLLDELMHMCVEWYSVRTRRRPSRKLITLNAHPHPPQVCSQLPKAVSVFSLDKHENSKHQVSNSRRSNHHTNPVTTCVCHLIEEKELKEVTAAGSQVVTCCDSATQCNTSSNGYGCQSMPQVTGLLTIAALSFHDIFEGIAVGVEHDLHSILFLYLSVASHKYAIAFCIGMDLVIAGSHLKMIVLSMISFSVVSPIGVIVGLAVVSQKATDEQYNIESPVSVILQGIAGGSLIYVVCFEVLQREGTDTHTKGIQNVAYVILGFIVTFGFKVLMGHVH